ncbi:low affinity immunoglobulin epsilon Fc receptor-like [Drosophila kikkawai]|uniref:Low affinity immunoglobulin epsilon Fc receptor-like n=1 Tax=Drosophila kikkawai TaxID=30033 RepID=A0ABM4GA64_DROKI
MQNFGTFLLWALATCILRQGSFAEDQSGYICLIEEPQQNQCDSICLTELSPRLNEVVKAQNQGNTNIRESDNEIKSKLETLEVKIGEVQAKLPQEEHAKLEGQLQGLQEGQTKLEGQQIKMEAKLEDSLLAVKTKLEGQLEGVEAKLEGHLQEVQTKVEAKLEKSLHEVKTKLEGQLQEVHAKLEGQLQEVEAKLEGHFQEVQTKVKAKLEDSLLAVKTQLEGQEVVLTKVNDSQAKLQGNLLAIQTNIEIQLQAVLNQLQAMSNKIDAAKDGVAASGTNTSIPSGFKLIGNRYFRIVKEFVDWEIAERRCRELGGYLASIQNEEELNAIEPKLFKYGYWLGINDRDSKGLFESVASHYPAPFLKWDPEQPIDGDHKQNCVLLIKGKMRHHSCKYPLSFFICQADNET